MFSVAGFLFVFCGKFSAFPFSAFLSHLPSAPNPNLVYCPHCCKGSCRNLFSPVPQEGLRGGTSIELRRATCCCRRFGWVVASREDPRVSRWLVLRRRRRRRPHPGFTVSRYRAALAALGWSSTLCVVRCWCTSFSAAWCYERVNPSCVSAGDQCWSSCRKPESSGQLAQPGFPTWRCSECRNACMLEGLAMRCLRLSCRKDLASLGMFWIRRLLPDKMIRVTALCQSLKVLGTVLFKSNWFLICV